MTIFYLDERKPREFLRLFHHPESRNWYYRFVFPDQATRMKSTAKVDYAEALVVAVAAYDEARQKVALGKSLTQPTLVKLADEFYSWCDILSVNDVQRARHKSVTRRLILPLFGDRPLGSMSKSDVDKFIAMRKGKIKDSSINIEINTFRVLSHFAVERGLRETPLRISNLPIDPEKVENSHFNFHDYLRLQRLLRTDPELEYMRLIVTLARQLGARVSELNNFKHGDYHPVRMNGSDWVKVHLKGKAKERKRLARPVVLTILRRLQVLTGTPEVMPWSVRKEFREFLLVHDLRYDPDGNRRQLGHLRHSKATARMRKGDVSREALAAWMGHSVAVAERIYWKFNREFQDRDLHTGAQAPRKHRAPHKA